MMNPQRRDVLHRAGMTAALAAACAAGVLRPSRLLAGWNQPAFDARKLPEALAALGIDRPAATPQLRIDAPDVADNGAFVPIEISSELPGTESLAVLVDRNPWPFIARFDVSRGALPSVSLRVRMLESSPVRVVALAGSGQHAAAKDVTVTSGGCVGDEADAAPVDTTPVPKPTRMRASLAGDVASVRALLAHPMENGLRKTAGGQPVPEHFIRSVVAQLNGRTVFEAELGRSVSANPLIGFKVKGARAGDRLILRWEDSKGLARTDEVAVGAP